MSILVSMQRVRVGESCFSLKSIPISEANRRIAGLPLETCFDTESSGFLRLLLGRMARLGYPGASELRTNFRRLQNWNGPGYPIPYTQGIFLCEGPKLRAAHPDGTVDTLHIGTLLSLKELGGPIVQKQSTFGAEEITYNRATAQEALQEFAIRAAGKPHQTPLLSEQMAFLTGCSAPYNTGGVSRNPG